MVTVKDAAYKWVSQMNGYPQDMIQTLMQAKPDDWHEVTMPSRYDKVYVFNLPEGCEDYEPSGEIVKVMNNKYVVKLNDDNTITLESGDFEVERDTTLPMWGWLWSFGNTADDYWMEEEDGIKVMSECGFRVYEHEEWGYFFGIDGAGYDFYGEHWIPAYKARGLQWHDKETEVTEDA